mmetsp:Transcript_17446/g.28965  ORF Transcript_17446/g.28965 Transcript_17446/m.28965 type:complete len:272 (+) Transcript_17446:254-1069(+)
MRIDQRHTVTMIVVLLHSKTLAFHRSMTVIELTDSRQHKEDLLLCKTLGLLPLRLSRSANNLSFKIDVVTVTLVLTETVAHLLNKTRVLRLQLLRMKTMCRQTEEERQNHKIVSLVAKEDDSMIMEVEMTEEGGMMTVVVAEEEAMMIVAAAEVEAMMIVAVAEVEATMIVVVAVAEATMIVVAVTTRDVVLSTFSNPRNQSLLCTMRICSRCQRRLRPKRMKKRESKRRQKKQLRRLPLLKPRPLRQRPTPFLIRRYLRSLPLARSSVTS